MSPEASSMTAFTLSCPRKDDQTSELPLGSSTLKKPAEAQKYSSEGKRARWRVRETDGVVEAHLNGVRDRKIGRLGFTCNIGVSRGIQCDGVRAFADGPAQVGRINQFGGIGAQLRHESSLPEKRLRVGDPSRLERSCGDGQIRGCRGPADVSIPRSVHCDAADSLRTG